MPQTASKPTVLLLLLLLGAGSAPAADLVEQTCQRIGKKLASVGVAECLGSQLSDSGARSVEGTPLLIKEYPPVPGRKPRAKILLLGGIHGDEYSSVSVVFKWMATLDKYHSGLFHWQVAPLVNPDGLLRRKSTRTNTNGVDLNRNFLPLGYYDESTAYWKTRARSDPRRFPGANPWSEPESLWLTQMIHYFEPDAIIAVHAPYGVVDFDGPSRGPKQLGPLYLNLLGTYPGSLGNYAGLRLGIPVVTIELAHAGIMPSEREISGIWVDLVSWLKNRLPQKAMMVTQFLDDPLNPDVRKKSRE